MPDWESASGFQFRRKGPAPAKPVANKTKAPAAERRELSTSRPKNPIPKRRHTVSWAKATAGRASSSRRSSVALRGKRVSAAHNGLVGLPHTDVLPSHYFRHIDAEASGPVRMRQLLLWCVQRAGMDLAARKELAPEVQQQVKEMVAQAVDGLVSRRANTSWYNMPASSSSGAPLDKNPLNEGNMKKIVNLEGALEKVGAQIVQWTSLVESNNAARDSRAAQIVQLQEALQGAADSDASNDRVRELAEGRMSLDLLSAEQKEHLAVWDRQESVVSFDAWKAGIEMDISLNIDRVKHAAYYARASVQLESGIFCDSVEVQIAQAYAERARKEMARVHEPMDLLRMLAANGSAQPVAVST